MLSQFLIQSFKIVSISFVTKLPLRDDAVQVKK